MKPGIYPGMPMADYLAIDAASDSILGEFELSAAHARDAIVKPEESTPAQILGSAIHAALLEPDDFPKRYACELLDEDGKRVPRRSKVQRAAWAEHEDKHPGCDFLTALEYQFCLSAQKEFWSRPVVQQLLGGQGANEVVVVWKDEETGELCKIRPDRLTTFEGWTTIVNVKTCPRGVAIRPRFQAHAAKYRYHRGAAMYLEGLNAIEKRDRRHVVLAVEKTNPFGAKPFEFTEDALESGRDDFHRFLRLYHRARTLNEWPGYETEVEALGIPKYLERFEE